MGSVLRPLLFLIYINDLLKLVLESNISCYANDSSLYYISKNIWDIVKTLNLDKVSVWMEQNLIQVKAHKSKSLILRGPRKWFIIEEVKGKVTMSCMPLQVVEIAYYVELIVDSHLNFEEHIAKVQKTADASMSILKHLAKNFPYQSALQTYNAYPSCYLEFFSSIWTLTCRKTNFSVSGKYNLKASQN